MKITLSAKELKSLGACEDGYRTFKQLHKAKTVTLSQAFKSNGWDDIWWYISEAYDEFSDEQKKDLRLLSADYAERVLPIFEKERAGDDRPRKAIQASRDYTNGLIDDAAWAAGDAARAAGAAGAAAWAAGAARAAAWAAGDAGDAAGDAGAAWAERKWQEEKLAKLFLNWESK